MHEVSQMTIKSSRKLRSKSVRQILNLAHYRFEIHLKHKAVEYNKVVVNVSEAYTSQTISWTGEILNNLGGKKVVTGIGWFSPRSRSGTDVLSGLKGPAWNLDQKCGKEIFSHIGRYLLSKLILLCIVNNC